MYMLATFSIPLSPNCCPGKGFCLQRARNHYCINVWSPTRVPPYCKRRGGLLISYLTDDETLGLGAPLIVCATLWEPANPQSPDLARATYAIAQPTSCCTGCRQIDYWPHPNEMLEPERLV
jgi:hypothetical protein